MRIRQLKIQDAPFMLEWMHDKDIVEKMNTDFCLKTLKDCENFIYTSWINMDSDIHLAVTDEEDEYLGTVSLKNIDKINYIAEFAITVRHKAMGTGISAFEMQSVLKIGTEYLGLESIYWCVRADNLRAIRFYDKNGYEKVKCVPEKLISKYKRDNNLIWYIWKKE